MTPRRVAVLLLGSGACALVYQMVWLRELRHVFGASTPATAVVLAVFMAGLGLGSAWLGRRADRVARPLRMYANLELAVGAFAALTPALVIVVRKVYIASGGTLALGGTQATLLRIGLSALVLLPPTILMGGTLPAAARAITAAADTRRSGTALLYGANTVGAVLGTSVATFVLLERYGNRWTLWLACGLNIIVALLAHMMDMGRGDTPPVTRERGPRRPDPNARFVLIAAALVGGVFLLLELVWYRVLAPLLGGSTYTFGLILAVALAGIGIGGLLYTRYPAPTMRTFAITCALEGAFVAVPFALGDRIALLALQLRPLGAWGLSGYALSWALITAIVALPAACVSGYQFPLLIGLLGRGDRALGRDVGLAYACNTAGAIIGSLAGGFLLINRLGALGVWKLCVLALVALAVAALLISGERGWRRSLAANMLALAACALIVLPLGPTAVWRHNPIGAGRVDYVLDYRDDNRLRAWMYGRRAAVLWQTDGRESTVALDAYSDVAFLVNGKSDGTALGDADTQVMAGLVAALRHGAVKRALVIGLGSGSSAGWIGKIDDVERVDVVEIEPAMAEVADYLSAVNGNALDNPKLHVTFADAREILLTTPETYDLIVSEPSNPYRAGIASLFTQEFYRSVKARLRPGGMFVQWLQGYEIDVAAVQTAYATVASEFAAVETWRGSAHDLLLMARDEHPPIDAPMMRKTIASEPYRTALYVAWRVDTLEGVLAHFAANAGYARAVHDHAGARMINHDERNALEFGVIRSLGRGSRFSPTALLNVARERGFGRPPIEGYVDWDLAAEERLSMGTHLDAGLTGGRRDAPSADARLRFDALVAWSHDQATLAVAAWEQQGAAPAPTAMQQLAMMDMYAAAGKRTEALAWIAAHPVAIEAAAAKARLHYVLRETRESFEALREALLAHRGNAWPCTALMDRALALAPYLADDDPTLVEPLVALLSQPFAAGLLRTPRLRTRFEVALKSKDPQLCVDALAPFEPWVLWEYDFLEKRHRCYDRAHHHRTAVAREQLHEFEQDAGASVERDMLPPP